MSDRIELEIVSILPAYSHGAYTLVLGEKNGQKKLPVLIGAFEAQAIAMELENVKASRPLTHDLMKNMLEELGAEITEIEIVELKEGVFFSKIICKTESKRIEIDSRTSDAIALAAKTKAKIFTIPSIMDEAAYEMEETDIGAGEQPGRFSQEELIPVSKSFSGLAKYDVEDLEMMLEEAIRDEDYKRAAEIRDEIAKRK